MLTRAQLLILFFVSDASFNFAQVWYLDGWARKKPSMHNLYCTLTRQKMHWSVYFGVLMFLVGPEDDLIVQNLGDNQRIILKPRLWDFHFLIVCRTIGRLTQLDLRNHSTKSHTAGRSNFTECLSVDIWFAWRRGSSSCRLSPIAAKLSKVS